MSKLAAMRTNVQDNNDSDVPTELDPEVIVGSRKDILLARTGMPTANDYQVEVFDQFDKQLENYQLGKETTGLLIKAVAGSGKSTVVIAASKLIPNNLRTVFLAFNKSIADELKTRLPKNIESSTLNSIGFKQIIPYCKSIGCNVDPRTFSKAYRTNSIIRNMYDWKSRDGHEKYVKMLVAKCKAMGVVPVGITDGVGIDNKTATDDTLLWLLKHFNETVDPTIRPTVFKMTRDVLYKSWSETDIVDTNCIDFDDQIWITVCKRPLNRPLFQPQYDVIICDECQDLSPTNIEMIRMLLKPNGIVMGVGDTHQCQPTDTRISMADGTIKNIQDINIGDRVVSYSADGPNTSLVTNIANRPYRGPMYTVAIGDTKSKSTLDHKWLARFNEDADNAYCVYLMEHYLQDDVYPKIGTCKLSDLIDKGIVSRDTGKQADTVWILEVADSYIEARGKETAISINYGVPQVIPSHVIQSVSLSQSTVGSILYKFNRRREYPIWSPYSENIFEHDTFVIQACNLIPHIMSMKQYDGDWSPLSIDRNDVVDERVYSLAVEATNGRRLYVSDNIVTHNSIYKFRGADTHAMNKFEEYFSATSLPLSITYRCSKQVTMHAQELVPVIQHAPDASDGQAPVYMETYSPDFFKGGDMILCRNNGPLLSLAYKFIAAKIPVYVKGRDIGDKLVSLINDCVGAKKWEKINGRNVPSVTIAGATTAQLSAALRSWKSKQIEMIRADDPDNETAMQSINDRFKSLDVFVAGNTDGKVTSIIKQIDEMFTQTSAKDMVVFSTVHKAKGLEADRVFMYSKECLYPWWIKRGTDDYIQETNIDYVARTRAKLLYGYLPTDGWTG